MLRSPQPSTCFYNQHNFYPMTTVSLSNLSKSFSSNSPAVRDLSLEVADGELVVLVGPSGAGKSTTLRMVAGLESPTSGEILIGGRRVNDLPSAERDVAMVFQNHALYPHMSVRQNLSFGLRVRGEKKATISAQIVQAAKLLGIEPLLDRRPHELSGGEQQRVALGRAIVRRPTVFLMDEPLSNLDPQLRCRMRAELVALHRRLLTTMLYVTHDQVEAMTLGNRLVVIKDGVVQQIGPPLDIYQHPANRFVATFIGSPAMNLITGGVENGVFRAGDVSWRVDSAYQGTAVLGVRPEGLTPATDGVPVFAMVRPTIVEQLGHEALLHFDLLGTSHVARLPSDRLATLPELLPLTIREGAYHLFEGDERGRALSQ